MKILVYGAGVLGSLYAARLQESGQEVSILARGQRLADLREHGIVLEDAISGHQTTTRVDVVEKLAPEDAYDLVIVLVPKNHVSEVLPALAANQHIPNVLFMGNNAAGPDEMVEALGWERVLLGFPGAGGTREGYIVRYMAGSGRRRFATTMGELDGRTTPRLEQIAQAFEVGGFPVTISPNMDAWLKTHVAFILPIGGALCMAGFDNYRLARTRDAVVLMIRAMHESLRVLRALNVPITPSTLKIFEWMPEPILVTLAQRRLNSEAVEAAFGHAKAARDEGKHLRSEFRALARSSSVPTPTMARLRTYVDQTVPPVPEGSAQIPMDWRGVWVALGALAGALAGLVLLWRLLRHRLR